MSIPRADSNVTILSMARKARAQYVYVLFLGWSIILIDYILWKSIGQIAIDHYPQLSIFFLNSIFMVVSFSIPIIIHSIKHTLLFKDEFCSLNRMSRAIAITFPVLLLLGYLYDLVVAKYYGGISVNPLVDSKAVLVIFFVILGPILEEILYRSIILKSLLEMTSVTKAIFIVAIINTLCHLATSRFIWFVIFTLLTEIILSISYLKGKLGACVLNHCLMNFIAFRMFFI